MNDSTQDTDVKTKCNQSNDDVSGTFCFIDSDTNAELNPSRQTSLLAKFGIDTGKLKGRKIGTLEQVQAWKEEQDAISNPAYTEDIDYNKK